MEKKLEQLGNHEDHKINIANYEDSVKIECQDCHEIIIELVENKDGDLIVKKDDK